MTTTHPQFLLPLRSHETFLGLLRFGRLLEPLAHFRALAVDVSLLGLLRLKYKLLPEIVTSCG
jgi:hypothetical protein